MVFLELFGPQSFYWVVLGRGFSGDETTEQGQDDTEADEDEGRFGIKRGADADISNKAVEDGVDDGDEDVTDADTKEPGQ